MEIKLDKRHIISTKSRGFFQTPQDIIEEYNGCSVPQYTAYPSYTRQYRGGPSTFLRETCITTHLEPELGPYVRMRRPPTM